MGEVGVYATRVLREIARYRHSQRQGGNALARRRAAGSGERVLGARHRRG
jgi:hypothetical protein